MGDYIYSYEKCPKCGKEIQVCDQTSSLLHSCHCDKCGYDDGKDLNITVKNAVVDAMLNN